MESDLISRSAAMKIVDALRNDDLYPVELDWIARDINDLPSHDVAPVVHGHWIHDINNLYGCSECRARETMSHKKKKNCCPNCSARMDGEAK